MKSKSLRYGLLYFILLPLVLWAGPRHQVVAFSFDWDDNVVYMPTKIYLYDRMNPTVQRDVSTADFAEIRHRVFGIDDSPPEYPDRLWRGVDWSAYRLMGPDILGSFREFRDSKGENQFRDGVVKMLALKKPADWQGPHWSQFVLSLSSPESTRWSSIITARGQEAEKIEDALKYLQRETGLINNVPPSTNIYAVSSAKYRGQAANPSLIKPKVMAEILERINREPLSPDMPEVLDRDGKKKAVLHLWEFSDDDYVNFTSAVAALSAQAKRWPNVKITIVYTGSRRAAPIPAVVIQSDGTVRPRTKEEKGEAARILDQAAGAASRPAPPAMVVTH